MHTFPIVAPRALFFVVPALLALTGGWLAPPARAGGLAPAEARKHFRAPSGFEVTLFAAEPEIRQPVSMTFDRRGRMWVIQYLQYPHPAGLKVVKVDNFLRTVYDRVPEPPPRGPRGADRITILEDRDGDGRMDKMKDFVSGLNLATGLALGHGGAFVVQAPYLLFYPDRNGDDVPDGDPEVLLEGFGMEDSHALANSLQWGPDGWLYGAQGSTVTANIRGIVFQQGIWRYHPRTKQFELFAEGGGNTWGVDFDRHGNLMAGTNYGGYAMLHQVQGAYYVKNFGKHGQLQNPYAFGYFEHVPYRDFRGGHVTCGGIVYRGGSFPDRYRDQYLAANVLSNAIYWHQIERRGSTFTNRFGGELMTTDDQWFRPVDCTIGPDGSLFVADWYDQRANHVDPRDDWDKSNGRIYKLVAAGTRAVHDLDLDKHSSAELVKLLESPNEWYSRQARTILAERRDPAVLPALRRTLVESRSPQSAIEALWALDVSGGFDEPLAQALLAHPEEDIRAWTIRLLGDKRHVSPLSEQAFRKIARTDPSPTVRNQLACTCKRLPGPVALPIAAKLLARDEDVGDPQIPLLIWWAIEDKAITDRAEVVKLFEDPRVWSRPITRRFLVERLGRRYAAQGEGADFQSCARLLALAPQSADLDRLVQGMEKGLEGRRLTDVPGSLAAPLARLWSQPRSSTTLIRFAVRLGSREARERATAQSRDHRTPEGDRVALVELEGQVGQPDCVPVLLELLGPAEPAAVRKAAISALQRFPNPEIADRVLRLYPKLPAGLKDAAKGLLCGRAAWAGRLLNEVDAGRLPKEDIASDHLRQIALLNDSQLNALLEKHWGKVQQESPAEKRALVHGILRSLTLAAGEPVRGRELFRKNCGTCHTLFGEGNKIGPDLTGIDRANAEYVLTNVIDPSAVIRKEYLAHTVVLNDGRVLNGLIAESTPATVTLLDAKNQRTVLAQSDIQEMAASPLSLMPEKILDPLNAQEIRDLMSYLRSAAPGAGR